MVLLSTLAPIRTHRLRYTTLSARSRPALLKCTSVTSTHAKHSGTPALSPVNAQVCSQDSVWKDTRWLLTICWPDQIWKDMPGYSLFVSLVTSERRREGDSVSVSLITSGLCMSRLFRCKYYQLRGDRQQPTLSPRPHRN